MGPIITSHSGIYPQELEVACYFQDGNKGIEHIPQVFMCLGDLETTQLATGCTVHAQGLGRTRLMNGR